MKKKRGHYCRICERVLPNERFSGKGHAKHICRECAALPKAEIEAIEQQNEIHSFMRQKNISENNRRRLTLLAQSANPRIATRARLVGEVARLHPRKKKRLGALRRTNPALLDELKKYELVEPAWDWYEPQDEEELLNELNSEELGDMVWTCARHVCLAENCPHRQLPPEQQPALQAELDDWAEEEHLGGDPLREDDDLPF